MSGFDLAEIPGIMGETDGAATLRTSGPRPRSEKERDMGDPSRWWTRRGVFVRFGDGHPGPTIDEWHALEDGRSDQLVYFIESVTTGLVKIGISSDPWGRMRHFEGALGGRPMRMLALEDGGRLRERHLHVRFCDLKVARDDLTVERWIHATEWFRPDAPLMDYLGPEPT